MIYKYKKNRQVSFSPDAIVYTYYTYRPNGLRHSIGSTKHAWDGGNIVADITSSTITIYVRGINLIYSDNGTDILYFGFNAHGDVIQLTDDAGAVVKTYVYDAFGVEDDIDNDDVNRFRYCGEYYDKVSATVYLRARYYDSANGRFMQQDGWGYAKSSDPLSLNLYTYCSNNPIKYSDPSGNRKQDRIETENDIHSGNVEYHGNFSKAQRQFSDADTGSGNNSNSGSSNNSDNNDTGSDSAEDNGDINDIIDTVVDTVTNIVGYDIETETVIQSNTVEEIFTSTETGISVVTENDSGSIMAANASINTNNIEDCSYGPEYNINSYSVGFYNTASIGVKVSVKNTVGDVEYENSFEINIRDIVITTSYTVNNIKHYTTQKIHIGLMLAIAFSAAVLLYCLFNFASVLVPAAAVIGLFLLVDHYINLI